MISAHCTLTGLELGASIVKLKYVELEVAAIAGAGMADEMNMKVRSASSAPVAECLMDLKSKILSSPSLTSVDIYAYLP